MFRAFTFDMTKSPASQTYNIGYGIMLLNTRGWSPDTPILTVGECVLCAYVYVLLSISPPLVCLLKLRFEHG